MTKVHQGPFSPIYPDVSMDIEGTVIKLTTILRRKFDDGKWYHTMVIQVAHISTNNLYERDVMWQNYIKAIQHALVFGDSLDNPSVRCQWAIDRFQESEEERLKKLYGIVTQP